MSYLKFGPIFFIILSFFVFLLVLPAAVNAIELRGGEDLDYSKLIEIVDSYNTSEIYITGGEPFLYRDLPLLLKELKKREYEKKSCCDVGKPGAPPGGNTRCAFDVACDR